MNRRQRRAEASRQIAAVAGRRISVTGGVQFAARKDGDDNKLPSVSMLAYTGAPVSQWWSDHPIFIDLESASASRVPMPILRDHDHGRVVGHVEAFDIDGEGMHASGVLSGANGDTEEIAASAKNGFPWQVSIGGSEIRKGDVEYVREDAEAVVNGRSIVGPALILKNQRIIEVSIVSLGADDATSAAIAASRSNRMTFEAWLDANGLRAAADESPQARTSLRRLWENTVRASADMEDDADPIDDGGDDADVSADAPLEASRRQPQRRQPAPRVAAASSSDVASIVRAELERDAEVSRILSDHPELAQRASSERWSIERAALECVRANRVQAAPSISTASTNANSMVAAILHRSGVPYERIEASGISRQDIDRATTAEYRNVGVHEILASVVQAAGGHMRPGRITDDTLREAFRASRRLELAGASTASLQGVMSSVVNRASWAAFTAVNRVLPRIARREEASDFKELERYRLTAAGKLELVGPDGNIKDGSLSDEKYTNRVETYAQRIGITRQMLINDDIGAIAQLGAALGRNAALRVEELGFTLLLSNPGTFFGGTVPNVATSSPLSVNGFTSAELVMLNQVDSDGKPILVAPSILLVPTSLKVIGEQLMTETRVNEDTTANVPKPANNPHAGKCSVLATPYLNAQGLANQSATTWYLFADPNDVPAMTLAYLNGNETPILESDDLDFSKLGMQWRVIYDFGIRMADKRGAVRATA